MSFDETIAAVSTPPGEGGIGIVRISGAEAYSIGKRIFVSQKVSWRLSPLSHLTRIYFREGRLIER